MDPRTVSTARHATTPARPAGAHPKRQGSGAAAIRPGGIAPAATGEAKPSLASGKAGSGRNATRPGRG